jgi:urate oxidase
MKLVSQNYGKQRVRVLKVLRDGPRHEVKELEIGVRLEGDFASSYTAGDNSRVVPTDTMKNAVRALAHEHLGLQTEPFAGLLAAHFLTNYPQVECAVIETAERRWSRLDVGGKPHDHAFTGREGRPLTKVVASRGCGTQTQSGMAGLTIMKSTGSGFAGFPKCAWTTLGETADRVLATSLTAVWEWGAAPVDFNAANAAILGAMLGMFATNYSPSVQATLHDMAAAAFGTCLEIVRLELAMPNKHYLPADLTPFGLDGSGVSFVPTDEPHGQIEAVFARGKA